MKFPLMRSSKTMRSDKIDLWKSKNFEIRGCFEKIGKGCRERWIGRRRKGVVSSG